MAFRTCSGNADPKSWCMGEEGQGLFHANKGAYLVQPWFNDVRTCGKAQSMAVKVCPIRVGARGVPWLGLSGELQTRPFTRGKA